MHRLNLHPFPPLRAASLYVNIDTTGKRAQSVEDDLDGLLGEVEEELRVAAKPSQQSRYVNVLDMAGAK